MKTSSDNSYVELSWRREGEVIKDIKFCLRHKHIKYFLINVKNAMASM